LMLVETLVTGPDTPVTTQLTTKGVPNCGGVPALPSGIAPTPVHGNVAAGADGLSVIFEFALIGFELAPNHKAVDAIPKTAMQ
jgi:hypothetical protein